MQFRTQIDPIDTPFTINHQDTVLLIGSCFSDHIFQQLSAVKFDTLNNPFGIQYDPYSISNTLYRIVENATYLENDLFYERGLWHSWDHHSKYSGADKHDVLEFINIHFSSFRSALRNAKVLFITLGTSFYFELAEHEKKVANCHKVPQAKFHRKMAQIGELLPEWEKTISALRDFNPELQIVFTVSPIRHIKNGLVDNQKSKSILRLLASSFDNCSYFPSYEIMMDDLRDYRFYEKDMIHINDTAKQYIWDYFQNVFFEENTIKINRMIRRINAAVLHKPFNPQTKEHQDFIRSSISNLKEVQLKFPYLNFSNQMQAFRSQLVE